MFHINDGYDLLNVKKKMKENSFDTKKIEVKNIYQSITDINWDEYYFQIIENDQYNSAIEQSKKENLELYLANERKKLYFNIQSEIRLKQTLDSYTQWSYIKDNESKLTMFDIQDAINIWKFIYLRLNSIQRYNARCASKKMNYIFKNIARSAEVRKHFKIHC